MSSLADVAVAYLNERDIPHRRDRSGIVAFRGGSEHGTWGVYIACLEREQQVVVHSVLDDPVPDDRRDAVALFLTRANFGLVVGNFELNLDDGELRYKTSVDVEGSTLDDALLDNIVIGNVAIFDRYLPGLRAVLDGDDPAEAVASIDAA